MRQWCDDTAYAIGLSSTNLINLRRAAIPVPDQVVMQQAARYYVRGDATRVSDGYRSCQWIWDVLAIETLASLMRLVGMAAGDTYKNVYIYTDLRDGLAALPEFRTYGAVMYMPVLAGSEGVPIARSPYALQSIKITFNKLVEV